MWQLSAPNAISLCSYDFKDEADAIRKDSMRIAEVVIGAWNKQPFKFESCIDPELIRYSQIRL